MVNSVNGSLRQRSFLEQEIQVASIFLVEQAYKDFEKVSILTRATLTIRKLAPDSGRRWRLRGQMGGCLSSRWIKLRKNS